MYNWKIICWIRKFFEKTPNYILLDESLIIG